MTPVIPSTVKKHLLILTFALMGIYIVTLAPTIHWLDSGELTAAALALSVPHPPGEPAWVLLANLFTLLPFGDIAYRVNLLSALSGALVFPAAFFCLLSWSSPSSKVSREMGQPPPYTLIMLAALGPCLTYPLWAQSIRAEVYALTLTLTLISIAFLGQAGKNTPRAWMLAALFGGLSASVHPLLAALAIAPAIVIAAVTRGLPKGGSVGATAFFAILGLTPYTLLPLRTEAGATAPWGTPNHLGHFVDVLLARSFQQNFTEATSAPIWNNLLALWDAITQGTGLLIPIFALIGIILGIRGGQGRGVFLAVSAAIATLWSMLTQNVVYATNVDLHGYLGLVHVMLWGLTALALYHLGRRLTDHRGDLLIHLPRFILGLFVLVAGLSQGELASRRGNDLALKHGSIALASTPPGGTLIASGNNTMFVLFYLEQVEDARPDVQMISRSLMGHPWYQDYKLKGHRPLGLDVLDIARRPPKFLPSLKTPVILEARERDFKNGGAAFLCPAGPDPGWGLYQLVPRGRCPPQRFQKPALGLSPNFEEHIGDMDAKMVTGLAQKINKAYRAAYLKEIK